MRVEELNEFQKQQLRDDYFDVNGEEVGDDEVLFQLFGDCEFTEEDFM